MCAFRWVLLRNAVLNHVVTEALKATAEEMNWLFGNMGSSSLTARSPLTTAVFTHPDEV